MPLMRNGLVDETFDFPRMPISVIAVGDVGEAFLVRSVLEGLGASVLFHLIGTPNDFLRALGQGEAASRYVVICAHGDENGFVFGDYGAGINIASLTDGSMPPESIADHVNLPSRVVVSTACGSGSEAFAAAFLKGGVSVYIAPNDSPEGSDAGLVIHMLFHQIMGRGASPETALARVHAYDSALKPFVAFRAPK
ncbi:MAG: hypothetical protein AB7E81_13325 [Hyphomicrobiaceae bacterium]